ncbi:MAG TPA: TetR/AcrR family transcriptional regulator C-terminal domain-containing protein [Propionibacteriaceae bacterium]|nr:TetR/AcrR family transcriptional regulator C-terminal domain-containing protein [Propionibacteriaceae bacterium]
MNADSPSSQRSTRADGGPTARGSLDRQLIIAEAVRLLDAHGLNQLTMRALGKELGVEAMALYRYVPSRDELLDGVVDAVLDEYVDPTELTAPSWQHFLQRVAHGVRTAAVSHPKIFPLVATRPPEAPWLRPPLRSLAWVEAFLARLRDYGFNDTGTVAVYRGFSTFLLGHLLLEVSSRGGDVGAAIDHASESRAVDLSRFPAVQRLAPQLAESSFDEEFEDSLENLLNRLGLLRASAS